MHDFIDKGLGKAIPYGVYDSAANTGCVSVGIDNDTALFFVNSSSRRLQLLGRERYPDMQQLTITADGGGSTAPASAVQGRTPETGGRNRSRASGLP